MENSTTLINQTCTGLLFPSVQVEGNKSEDWFAKEKYFKTTHLLRLSIDTGLHSVILGCLDNMVADQQDKCKRLLLFLAFANEHDVYEITRQDLGKTIGVNRPGTITNYIKILTEKNLIQVAFTFKEGKRYNTYAVTRLRYEPKMRYIKFEYNVEPILAKNIKKQIVKKQNAPAECRAFAHQPKRPTATKTDESTFIDFSQRFLDNYTHLFYNGIRLDEKPHIQEDGRIRHQIHDLRKAVRLTSVQWGGEHIVEVWDASNEFFALLYAKLLLMNYGSTDEVIQFGDLVFSKRFYETIGDFFFNKTHICLTRDSMKILVQQYKNTYKEKLLNENGSYKGDLDRLLPYYKNLEDMVTRWQTGRLKENTERALCKYLVRYVDMFFIENFETVRRFILSFPPYQKPFTYKRKGKDVHSHRLVSSIQKEIQPLETSIIAYRMCKTLYEKYGIESITVYDAIYVKASQVKKIAGIDMDKLFRITIEGCRPVTLF